MGAEPLILHRWSSRMRPADPGKYVSIKDTGVKDDLDTPDNVGCEVRLRECGDGSTEVSTLSWPRSMEAICGFAGHDVNRARHHGLDDRSLIQRPEHVEHHIVVAEALGLPRGAQPFVMVANGSFRYTAAFELCAA